MAPAETPERTLEMNAMICVFNIDKEGFYGISSIKTDIYYSLGMFWFAAISKWTQDYGRTRSTFQNKPQVSFSNIRPVPTGSPDPRDSFMFHGHTFIVSTMQGGTTSIFKVFGMTGPSRLLSSPFTISRGY